MDAQYWIDRLDLSPHPEGGYYRETYRSHEKIAAEFLPERFSGDRVFSTSIYFLLTSDQFSAFHRVQQDELWHFHAGDPLIIHMIGGAGDLSTVRVGSDIDAGSHLQAVVPGGAFFAAEILAPGDYALVSCTVAPGFEFDDFELPAAADLVVRFPQHAELIQRLAKAR